VIRNKEALNHFSGGVIQTVTKLV